MNAQPDAQVRLNDWLYVDRERIGALYTQLIGSGVPLESKFTENYNRAEVTNESVGVPKFFGGGFTSTEGDSIGSERRLDATWPMIMQTLAELSARGHIHQGAIGVPVGSLIRLTGLIQLVDLRLMRDMWSPMMKYTKAQAGNAKVNPSQKLAEAMAELIKHMPHPLIAQITTTADSEDEPFRSDENSSLTGWGNLSPEYLLGSADPYILMNGGHLPGMYSMIGVLDVGSGEFPDISGFEPKNSFELMFQMQLTLRKLFGRPDYANGLTPLAIFRSLKNPTLPVST